MNAAVLGPADYARRCVEALTQGHPAPEPPANPLFAVPAACFVSIKRLGALRGCIGTLEPAEDDLGHEIARNALCAATRDPRFPPVVAAELDELSYSVDVLSPSVPASREDLDPRRFGVIVCTAWRRGVLLPDLPGIFSVEEQVEIALQKAGIRPDEDYDLLRFTVTRYAEGDRLGRATDMAPRESPGAPEGPTCT